MMKEIVDILDKVAGSLEAKGLRSEAEQIDVISNTIEKQAKRKGKWPKKLEEGRFTEYCRREGFKGPCKACADKAMKSDDASVRGMASFYINTTLKRKKAAEDLDGFVVDIESETKDNKNFRKVLYTGEHTQLVVMALGPNEDIGEEVHDNLDQFFRVDDGSGKVIINGKEKPLKDGSAFIIPGGTKHNVIAGDGGLKLYTLYSPPNHEDGTVHKTKEIAESSE